MTITLGCLFQRTEATTTEEEKIAQRTRSKHPLHDVSITSLEAGLGSVEGEDPPTPRELDPDELWWHQWLNSLTTDPLNGIILCVFGVCVYRITQVVCCCSVLLSKNTTDMIVRHMRCSVAVHVPKYVHWVGSNI